MISESCESILAKHYSKEEIKNNRWLLDQYLLDHSTLVETTFWKTGGNLNLIHPSLLKMEVLYELKDKEGNVIKTFERKTVNKKSAVIKNNLKDIKKMSAAGVSRKDIAKHYGISTQTLRQALGPVRPCPESKGK